MMPLVSVIIPTYNRANLLTRAIDSVFSQTLKDLELIVVDDGSTDLTKVILQGIGDKLIYITHPENRGPAAARNTGIRRASAPLLAFLDSDDYWLPDKLRVQVEFFSQNPEAVACQTEEIWIRRERRVNPKKIHRKPSGYIFDRSLRLCLISPSAVMIRRTVFDKIGLFDEALPVCEDYDLWLRLTCRWPVYLISKPLVVKYGGHADQLSKRFWGMDRFRIRSIVKIIASGILSPEQRSAALRELERKCKIYALGCIKRGKEQEGRFFEELPQLIKKGSVDPLNSTYLRDFHCHLKP